MSVGPSWLAAFMTNLENQHPRSLHKALFIQKGQTLGVDRHLPPQNVFLDSTPLRIYLDGKMQMG